MSQSINVVSCQSYHFDAENPRTAIQDLLMEDESDRGVPGLNQFEVV